jgi:hypothetical protein
MGDLKLMREPFPDNQIGKLAKGSKAQMQCDAKEKVNCKVCGGWHHPKLVHLSFVGHAALTDRLLDVDPVWVWEPLAFTDQGLPLFDESGGLWIKLTVCGHTRLGYGNAEKSQYKEIGSREKEVIGDALRNAAMRFGAALELWHKGDLHIPEIEPQTTLDEMMDQIDEIAKLGEIDALITWYKNRESLIKTLNETEQSTIVNTLKATRALLEEQAAPVHEAEIICPNGVSGVTDAECAKCAGREGCPAHK